MIDKQPKVYKKTSIQAPEEVLKPTYLSSLFKPPADPAEAKAERDRLCGRTPSHTHTHKSSTFTI